MPLLRHVFAAFSRVPELSLRRHAAAAIATDTYICCLMPLRRHAVYAPMLRCCRHFDAAIFAATPLLQVLAYRRHVDAD